MDVSNDPPCESVFPIASGTTPTHSEREVNHREVDDL